MALFDPAANRTGSMVAFGVSLILRLGGGEPVLGMPATIPYQELFAPILPGSASISTLLTGAAEQLSRPIHALGGTRCNRALTVVQRRRGRYSDERVRARRDSTVMRCADIAALGEMRS